MKRVCVFCGAAEGARPAYAEAARRLGAELVARGLGLVYGGCAIGMMGILADTVLAHGGEVIGVIPSRLASRELAHAGLTELRVVDSMHERKATMATRSPRGLARAGSPARLSQPRLRAGRARVGASRASAGICASCSAESSFQMIAAGLRCRRRTRITRSGVTTTSSGTSWAVIGIAAARTWSSWTVVTTGVSSSTRPSERASANSRSL